MLTIRSAQLEDAAAIARCHIAAWRDAYRPVLADEVLNNISLEDKAVQWREKLLLPNTRALIAEIPQIGIVGFLYGGPERTGRFDFRGEIYGVYLLKEYRAQGIGRQLFQAFARSLAVDQIATIIVWALEGNDCRAAYAAWGGAEIERGPIKIGEQELTELAYGWRDVQDVL